MAKAEKTRLDIDNESKVIYCDIGRLEEGQEAVLEKYKKQGYQVLQRQKKKTVKPATAKKCDYDFIVEYLTKKAPAEKVEFFKAEAAKDKGFMSAATWFKTNFPEDTAEVDTAIKAAGLQEEFDRQAAAYQKKRLTKAEQAANKEKLSPDEYKRNYYWRKIFGK